MFGWLRIIWNLKYIIHVKVDLRLVFSFPVSMAVKDCHNCMDFSTISGLNFPAAIVLRSTIADVFDDVAVTG